MSKDLDIEYVRNIFPVFRNPKTKDLAFFENAGGTYVPDSVINKLNKEKKHLAENTAKAAEDLQVAEDKVTHFNNVKFKCAVTHLFIALRLNENWF